MTGLPPSATIGIVGGGQLGRMSALAAARLGYRCHILTPESDSPAALVSAGVTLAEYEDQAALRSFAAAVDIITFEFENVSAEELDLLASLKPVHPSPAVLRVSQDRAVEKGFLNGIGVATAPWLPVDDMASLADAATRLGLPAILKTTRLGYDGKGQAMIGAEADFMAAFDALEPKPLVLEGLVDFSCEISVIVARGANGMVAAFDAVENSHRDHILDMTYAPARVTAEIAAEAQAIARKVADALDLVGLLAVEMFVAADGRVLVNEIAPRPHNSGHWTIDACPFSQFELHIRAIAGLPLPRATRHADAVMKNLVGPEEAALWPELLATPGLIPHLYGKAEARAGRKMGHVTRLFALGGLPGPFGIARALGPLSPVGNSSPSPLEGEGASPLVIYLAGPDVFRPDAVAWGMRLKALCADAGAIGLYPLDNAAGLDPAAIRAANLAMIERCDAVVANITPFRGPSADVGTVYELGYAAALDKLVVAYSADAASDYAARVPALSGEPGAPRDRDDMLIEAFDPPLTDNLMLACGVDALLADAELAIRSAVAMLLGADCAAVASKA